MTTSSNRADLFAVRTPGQVLAFGLGAFAFSYLGALVVGALLGDVPALALSLMVSALGMITIPLVYIRRQQAAVGASLRVAPLHWPQVLWLLGMTVAAVPAVLALAAWNQELVPPPPEYVEWVEALRPTDTGDWILSVLAVVVFGPLGEEIVFRGLIQHAARFVLGRGLAMLFTALVFAVAHGQPWNLGSLLLMGLLLALVFEATGSLLAPIVVHSSYNLTLLLVQTYGTTVPDLPVDAAAFGAVCALAVGWAAYGRLRRADPWPEDTDPDPDA